MSVFQDLQIIIVNWNLKNDTLACIDSVLKAGIEPSQIILVDNASTDGSVIAINEHFGDSLAIISTETNLGFAGGSNIGIQRALEYQVSWILLLNNDIVVDREMFIKLASAVENSPKYSIVAPLIFYYYAPEIIWSAGDRLIKGTFATRSVYHKKRKPKDLPKILDVDFITGSGMLISRAVFDDIGLFDKSLFMYAEEVDFIWRARLAGYLVGCVTEAHMFHKISLSSKRDPTKTRYLRIRNQIWVYRKYAHGIKLPIMFGIVMLRSAWIGIKDIVLGHNELILPLIQGWLDGWFSIETNEMDK